MAIRPHVPPSTPSNTLDSDAAIRRPRWPHDASSIGALPPCSRRLATLAHAISSTTRCSHRTEHCRSTRRLQRGHRPYSSSNSLTPKPGGEPLTIERAPHRLRLCQRDARRAGQCRGSRPDAASRDRIASKESTRFLIRNRNVAASHRNRRELCLTSWLPPPDCRRTCAANNRT